MNFDWKQNGFQAPPALQLSTGGEQLYRAWGGHPGRKWGNRDLPGVCFSLDRAATRWHAEQLYAVFEYQNPVWYITRFAVPRGIPLWIGRVDPGHAGAVLGQISGSQVLIERAHIVHVTEVPGSTESLQDDLRGKVVYSGRPPRLDA